jgi:hypothetical protein
MKQIMQRENLDESLMRRFVKANKAFFFKDVGRFESANFISAAAGVNKYGPTMFNDQGLECVYDPDTHKVNWDVL